jgi:hypothetical protein
VIIAVPAATPVTTPVELMVATPVLLLLHVPPGVISDKLVVRPTQTLSVPVIAAGFGLTVMITVAIQPTGDVAVMVTVPAETPVTTPVDEPTVAIRVLFLRSR